MIVFTLALYPLIPQGFCLSFTWFATDKVKGTDSTS